VIARPNESARHGFRVIVGFRAGERAFFFFGFAKNEADAITDRALKEFRARTRGLMGLPEELLNQLMNEGELREIERLRINDGGNVKEATREERDENEATA